MMIQMMSYTLMKIVYLSNMNKLENILSVTLPIIFVLIVVLVLRNFGLTMPQSIIIPTIVLVLFVAWAFYGMLLIGRDEGEE